MMVHQQRQRKICGVTHICRLVVGGASYGKWAGQILIPKALPDSFI